MQSFQNKSYVVLWQKATKSPLSQELTKFWSLCFGRYTTSNSIQTPSTTHFTTALIHVNICVFHANITSMHQWVVIILWLVHPVPLLCNFQLITPCAIKQRPPSSYGCKLTICAVMFQPTFFALFFKVIWCFLHKTPGFSKHTIHPNYTSSANVINTVFSVEVI